MGTGEGARYRFEIQVLRTVLGENGESTVLLDRCTVDTETLPMAAAEYAKLFVQRAVEAVEAGDDAVEESVPLEGAAGLERKVSWCEAGGCQAAGMGLECEECEKDLSQLRHAVVEDEFMTYSLCEGCAEKVGV